MSTLSERLFSFIFPQIWKFFYFFLPLLLKSRNAHHLCTVPLKETGFEQMHQTSQHQPPQTHPYTHTHTASKHSSSRFSSNRGTAAEYWAEGTRAVSHWNSLSLSISLSSPTDNYTHVWMCTSMSNSLMECKDAPIQHGPAVSPEATSQWPRWGLHSCVWCCRSGFHGFWLFESPSALLDPFSL